MGCNGNVFQRAAPQPDRGAAGEHLPRPDVAALAVRTRQVGGSEPLTRHSLKG